MNIYMNRYEYIYIYTYVCIYVYERGGLGYNTNSRQWKLIRYSGVVGRKRVGLKVPCSYSLAAMVKFALLRYLSEF